MESLPFIAWCLKHLTYWVICLLMAIESSFIPFPSEVVVPPAAYMAATTGELNVFLVFSDPNLREITLLKISGVTSAYSKSSWNYNITAEYRIGA